MLLIQLNQGASAREKRLLQLATAFCSAGRREPQLLCSLFQTTIRHPDGVSVTDRLALVDPVAGRWAGQEGDDAGRSG